MSLRLCQSWMFASSTYRSCTLFHFWQCPLCGPKRWDTTKRRIHRRSYLCTMFSSSFETTAITTSVHFNITGCIPIQDLSSTALSCLEQFGLSYSWEQIPWKILCRCYRGKPLILIFLLHVSFLYIALLRPWFQRSVVRILTNLVSNIIHSNTSSRTPSTSGLYGGDLWVSIRYLWVSIQCLQYHNVRLQIST
jgi:hypothetical protein